MRLDELSEQASEALWELARSVQGPVQVPYSERCVECGERIEAPNFEEFQTRYNDHQSEVHGKPRRAPSR